MMLEFRMLDVFTETAFAGNPLAVVLGADGLTTAQIQTIARAFNLSETIFVQAPQDPATGSASAILAAQLWASGASRPGTTRLTLRQGYEMGRANQFGPNPPPITASCHSAPISEGPRNATWQGNKARLSCPDVRRNPPQPSGSRPAPLGRS